MAIQYIVCDLDARSIAPYVIYTDIHRLHTTYPSLPALISTMIMTITIRKRPYDHNMYKLWPQMYTSLQVHLPDVLFRSMKGWSGAMVDWLGQVLFYRDSKFCQRQNDESFGTVMITWQVCGLGNLKPGLFISRSRQQANLNLK